MVGEMLREKWGGSYVKSGVSIGKEAVFVDDVDQMAKFIVSKNAKHLRGIVPNKCL